MQSKDQKFSLKYGQSEIVLTQSRSLIGVRSSRSNAEEASQAVQRELVPGSWRDAGTTGGFNIVAIEDAGIDADETLDRLRLDNSIAVGTHVFELPNQNGIYVPTGELLVEFVPGTPKEKQEAALDEFGLAVKEKRENDGFLVAATASSPNPIKAAVGLQAKKEVSIAEPDLATRAQIKAFIAPVDDLHKDQWHLRNTGFHRGTDIGFLEGADARVLEAWNAGATLGSAEVVVAVIDDGFDLGHPDFSVPGKTKHPWDFTRQNNDPRPAAGDNHGTACAGVAVAAHGGGGVLGAAPGCTLMPVRWGRDISDNQIEAWFAYVTDKGASVVSCSWGAANPYFPLSTRAYRAIENCARNGRGGLGCVVVFAAGNDDRNINDPASGSVDGFAIHPDVIAVAASTSRDQRSHYSNFGDEISVCAPSSGAGGWGVLTADVTGTDPISGLPLGYSSGDYTHDFGGTSSACPLVAGVAALILSLNRQLTSTEVKEILQRTARKIGSEEHYGSDGHSPEFGFGCVNALEAVMAVMNVSSVSVEKAKPIKPKHKQRTRKKAAASW